MSKSYDVGKRFDVTCDCSLTFCWNCLEESHRPVKCETVAKWKLENSSESENPIIAVCKLCPNCRELIQNNKVTMHMTCSCKHEFCWICLGPYKDHDYTACNSYRENVEQEKGVEERVAKRVKRCYPRYFHYYERFVANHKSREKALAYLNEIKTEKLEQLRELDPKAREFGFLAEAWEQIVECRQVLKWSYAYGYYMPEEASSKTKLFEYLQGEAEVALERLHDCAENTLEKYLKLDGLAHEFATIRVELVNRTRVTKEYLANFVKGVSNGLSEAEGDPLES